MAEYPAMSDSVNENSIRCQRIAHAWNEWLTAHTKACKHLKSCAACKKYDDPAKQETIIEWCPQAPPLPPDVDFSKLG